MAIEIVVGNVGSGKSYYATYRIWQEIKKMYQAEIEGREYKYKVIWTNIEGFKPNKYVRHLKVNELIKLYEEELKLYRQWEEAKKQLESLKEINFKNPHNNSKINNLDDLYQNEIIRRVAQVQDNIKVYKNLNEKILDHIKLAPEESEQAYIEYIKPKFEEAEFAHALFVIDEAHNFFKFLNPAKQRLVTYHRHYDQDYILITQEPRQLDRRITSITQKTIKASNPILKGRKSFSYKVYSGGYISRIDNNLLERIRLRADEDIFKLYTSGSVKSQKSHFYKLIAKMLTPLVIVIAGLFYLLHSIQQGGLGLSPKPVNHPPSAKTLSATPIPKKEAPPEWIKFSALKVGNFYIYNKRKYPASGFYNALQACNVMYTGETKNFDSTVIYFYRIKKKDMQCLKNYLSLVPSL